MNVGEDRCNAFFKIQNSVMLKSCVPLVDIVAETFWLHNLYELLDESVNKIHPIDYRYSCQQFL